MIKFEVRGDPQALKRHRTGVIYRKGKNGKAQPVMDKNGRVITREFDPSAEDKKDFLSAIQNNAPPKLLDGPLYLEVQCFFLRPKAHYGTGRNEGILKPGQPIFHSKKPDADNVIKFVSDSMNEKYFRDDSQISIELCVKKYADNYPYVKVVLMTVEEFLDRYDRNIREYAKQLSLEL